MSYDEQEVQEAAVQYLEEQEDVDDVTEVLEDEGFLHTYDNPWDYGWDHNEVYGVDHHRFAVGVDEEGDIVMHYDGYDEERAQCIASHDDVQEFIDSIVEAVERENPDRLD